MVSCLATPIGAKPVCNTASRRERQLSHPIRGLCVDNSTANQTGSDNRTLAILVHVSGIFFNFLAPLIVFLIKKDDGDRFTVDNAREALNFQITVTLVYFACFILSFILIGLFMFWIVGMVNLILCIVAAVKASEGKVYRYPIAIRLVK